VSELAAVGSGEAVLVGAPVVVVGCAVEPVLEVLVGEALAVEVLEPPEVTTAIETAASTSTAVTAITARCWPRLLGKSARRAPMRSESTSAHATSRPPAM
jgi:hypothetical protein